MGYYTRIQAHLTFKHGTPLEVWEILEWMTGTRSALRISHFHPLIAKHRTAYMLRTEGECTLDRKMRTLVFRSELKNYDNEIESFVEFVRPYLESVVDGFIQGEDMGPVPLDFGDVTNRLTDVYTDKEREWQDSVDYHDLQWNKPVDPKPVALEVRHEGPDTSAHHRQHIERATITKKQSTRRAKEKRARKARKKNR